MAVYRIAFDHETKDAIALIIEHDNGLQGCIVMSLGEAAGVARDILDALKACDYDPEPVEIPKIAPH
jgi:hypothetical protein